jgi:cell wall-associated NlpC family hydrolase
MEAAGVGYVGGNACDMYANYCTSSNRSDLQVGMIIAVSTHSLTSAGRLYGHVGIYVGGGTVMDNVGYIRSISVDTWISTYDTTVTPRWGWAGGVVLS